MRIYFRNSEDCFKFFEEARNSYNAKSWRELAVFIKTKRSVLDKYRYRILCLPEDKFYTLLDLIDKDKKEHFLEAIERRNENWGRVLGGINSYKINKESFDTFRKIANKGRNGKLKYNFDINMPLSEELCEFIGVVIGDGCVGKYGTGYSIIITGDKNLDKNYYYNNLKKICGTIFNINPAIYLREDCIQLKIYSKRLFELLTLRFNFPSGKKAHTIAIPSEIYKNIDFLKFTLRGMFNTDGGVGYDKRKIYKYPYIRVNYSSASSSLINQIHDILIYFNINHSIHQRERTQMIQINGNKNVRQFISQIGFSNERHTDKLKYLYQ